MYKAVKTMPIYSGTSNVANEVNLAGHKAYKKKNSRKNKKSRPFWNYQGISNEYVKAGGIVPMVYKDGEIYLLLRKIRNPLTNSWHYEDNGGKSNSGDLSYVNMQIREFCEETNGVIQSSDNSDADSDTNDDNPYKNDSNPFSVLEISQRHKTFEEKFEYKTIVNNINRSKNFIGSLMKKNPKVDIFMKSMKYIITFLSVDEHFYEKYPSTVFGKKEVYEDIERTMEWVSLIDFLNAIKNGHAHARLSHYLDLKIQDQMTQFVSCFSDKVWNKTKNIQCN